MTILPLRIDVSISESQQQYDLVVEQGTYNFPVQSAESITVNLISGPEYEGPYTIVPKVDSQTLETKDKLMVDDVLVREIPYYETSNVSNGITVFIADTLND